MTESEQFRKQAMDMLRRMAPADYLLAVEREREVEIIARNAASVDPIVKGSKLEPCGTGPMLIWLPRAA